MNFNYDIMSHPLVFQWIQKIAIKNTKEYLRLISPSENRVYRVLGDTVTHSKPLWKIERGNLVLLFLNNDNGTKITAYYPGSNKDFMSDENFGHQIINTLEDLIKSFSQSTINFNLNNKE